MSLNYLSVGQLVAAFRTGTLTPVDVIEATLERIARFEPSIHAAYAIDAVAARSAAKTVEQRWRTGKPIGALNGVPETVKDNIQVQGIPTPIGTAACPLVPAAADAPPVARLREAGAIIIAKTTMPEFGMLSSSLSSYHPLTRNPWDLSRTPGGSSGG